MPPAAAGGITSIRNVDEHRRIRNPAPEISRCPLTCSLSRCPRRRGCCRSKLRDGGGGGDDCCPTNWNWPSHRSYSRPAPGPEDGPSPENDARPSVVSSQKSSSIAAAARYSRQRPRSARSVFIASRHRLVSPALARTSSSPRGLLLPRRRRPRRRRRRDVRPRRANTHREMRCSGALPSVLPRGQSRALPPRPRRADSTCQEYTPSPLFVRTSLFLSLSLFSPSRLALSDRPLYGRESGE